MAKPQAERSISQKYVVRPWFVLFLSGIGKVFFSKTKKPECKIFLLPALIVSGFLFVE